MNDQIHTFHINHNIAATHLHSGNTGPHVYMASYDSILRGSLFSQDIK